MPFSGIDVSHRVGRYPPLSDGILKAWAGSGLGLGQAFFCFSLRPPLSGRWAWSTQGPKADIKGGGAGAKPPHESGRPKADFFDFSTLGGLIKVCALEPSEGGREEKK